MQMQGELNGIRDEIMKFKVGAPARVGLVAPNDVEVPAGGTGLDPSSTNFFQVHTLTFHCAKCLVHRSSSTCFCMYFHRLRTTLYVSSPRSC